MKPNYAVLEAKVTAIETEMKRSGLWQNQSRSPDQYVFQQAFAMDTLAFNQWLQFIFIPRVRDIIETRGEFPSSGSVGAQAVREFDGFEEAAKLVSTLSEFDAVFRQRKQTAATLRSKSDADNTDSRGCFSLPVRSV